MMIYSLWLNRILIFLPQKFRAIYSAESLSCGWLTTMIIPTDKLQVNTFLIAGNQLSLFSVNSSIHIPNFIDHLVICWIMGSTNVGFRLYPSIWLQLGLKLRSFEGSQTPLICLHRCCYSFRLIRLLLGTVWVWFNIPFSLLSVLLHILEWDKKKVSFPVIHWVW